MIVNSHEIIKNILIKKLNINRDTTANFFRKLKTNKINNIKNTNEIILENGIK